MESLLHHLFLDSGSDDSDDDQREMEPLTGKELQLMNLIKANIRKRKYKDIPKLYTANRHAASNKQMLPKMWLHLYTEVCRKYLKEEVYEENRRLFNCAEQLLKLIANAAPAEDFLIEIMPLLDPYDGVECVFNSVLGVIVPPLLRVPDEDKKSHINVFEEFLEEISMRRQMLLIPNWLALGLSTDISSRLNSEEELQSIMSYYTKMNKFYAPLLTAVCDERRPKTEIFRSCITNKRNILCCFLINMLEKPLSLFDLRIVGKGMRLSAVSLTTDITKCIGDPFFFLNFVEEMMRLESDTNSIATEETVSNYFLKDDKIEAESLTIYYYMVIVEEICLTQVPKVYNPLYVCEKVMYLVHHTLNETAIPVLKEKALILATVALTKLGNLKLSTSHLEDFIFKEFLNDLRNLALAPLTPNVLLLTANALKHYILCFEDDVKYSILKNLMSNVIHPSFCGFLITVYKDLVAQDLEKSFNGKGTLSPIYMGEHLRVVLLGNICKLPQGVKTDPAENYDLLEAALEAIEMFAKKDTNNVTGFWNFVSEINSQFISPMRKALQFFDSRFKTEILNVRQGRGLFGKKGGLGSQIHTLGKINIIESLKNNLSQIAKLRVLLAEVSEALANPPLLEDQNNNAAKKSAAKAK